MNERMTKRVAKKWSLNRWIGRGSVGVVAVLIMLMLACGWVYHVFYPTSIMGWSSDFGSLISNDPPMALTMIKNSSLPPYAAVRAASPLTSESTPETHAHIKALPLWVQEYFSWHARMRLEYCSSSETWKQKRELRPKLLILHCTQENSKCGGTADRLKPLPLILLGAHQSQRLFFIRWRGKPCPLEEFMVPPTGSLDWRVPDWMEKDLEHNEDGHTARHIFNVQPFLSILKQSPEIDVVKTTIQWWDGGEQAYKNAQKEMQQPQNLNEFRSSYHDLFRALFQPTQPIQSSIDHIYNTTALKPRSYSVAHYRAFWWEQQDPPTPEVQEQLAVNAVHCARRLNPSQPVFFATDSTVAQELIQNYTEQTRRPIVVIPRPRLVHLDHVEDISTNNNSAGASLHDLYPVFVDLWIMANANCISHGDGGFGVYGLLLSQNFSCSFRHILRHNMRRCVSDWKDH